MPGYVIHLSVAKEYLRKHKDKNENDKEFMKGVIFPDGVEDKSKTHYGEKSSKSNLVDFLNDNEINNSFQRGYFLHLLTDYLFYNHYIECMSKDMYNDYDILNKILIEKYEIELPEKAKKKVFFKNGNLTILSLELVEKMIKEISEMDLENVAKEVIENPKKWTTMRELKRI